MRLLFLTYSYLPRLGGVERSVDNLAALMAGRGHQVTIVTHGATAIPFRYQRVGRYAVLRIHIPSQTDSRFMVRLLRPVLNGINILILAGFCLGRRVNVVHTHLLNMDTVYAGWLRRSLGLRFVLTLRGGETEEWLHRQGRRPFLLKRLREADAVTAVSRSLLDQAVALVPEIGKHGAVIPNPVDPGVIARRARSSCARPAVHPYLLFAGRLEPMKDVACLLEAYTLQIQRDPAFLPDLVIVGEGSLAEPLRHLAQSGAAADRIRFLGRLPQVDTLRWIAGANALVLPSRCSEGCPNVLLEAMALATPVVVSDLPSLLEWVDDRVTGTVFPIGRPELLADRLQELGTDHHARQCWAQEARARLLRHFTMDSVAAAYEAVYGGLPSEGA